MTQINPPGYPLPDGDLGEDELVCQLVYLPDRPEYWQALLAAVHYFATWKAWERDDDKRGKDAAANWRDAFELTIGCWRMTCLEELTETVTDILELLQTKKDCCDENITYLPYDDIETDIEPGVGDPPDEYGETEIADWDEWAEHVCYNAHVYVDYLSHAGDSLWDAAKFSSIGIGLVAAVLTLLAFSGIGLPIAYGLAAGIVSGIVLGGQIATFAGTSEAIEDARNDIVCAILQGGDLAAAVELALESGLDWDLFYQFIPYENAIAIIYEGGVEGDYLPAETRDDCTCLPGEYYLENLFTIGKEDPWKGDNNWSSGYGGSLQMITGNHEIEASKADINTAIGVGGTGNLKLHRIDWIWRRSTANRDPRLRIVTDEGVYVYEWPSGDTSFSTMYEKSVTFDPPRTLSDGVDDLIKFYYALDSCWVNVGEIHLWLDTV